MVFRVRRVRSEIAHTERNWLPGFLPGSILGAPCHGMDRRDILSLAQRKNAPLSYQCTTSSAHLGSNASGFAKLVGIRINTNFAPQKDDKFEGPKARQSSTCAMGPEHVDITLCLCTC